MIENDMSELGIRENMALDMAEWRERIYVNDLT